MDDRCRTESAEEMKRPCGEEVATCACKLKSSGGNMISNLIINANKNNNESTEIINAWCGTEQLKELELEAAAANKKEKKKKRTNNNSSKKLWAEMEKRGMATIDGRRATCQG